MTAAVVGLALVVILLGLIAAGAHRRQVRGLAAPGGGGRPPAGTRPPRRSMTGRPAPPVTGVAPDSESRRVDTGQGRRLVLAFLTSSCTSCAVFWSALDEAAAARRRASGCGGAEPEVVVVTPDPTTEDARVLRRISPDGVVVVMSTAAWHDYAVTGSPWFAVVADGVVRAEGVAVTWSELLALIPVAG